MSQRCRMPAPASPATVTAAPTAVTAARATVAAVRAAVPTTSAGAPTTLVGRASVPAQSPATLAIHEAGRAFA
ncbi:hypothetical protein ACFRMQ_17370 [Kitasatospora sp. NPDC056783]|uniref:hypothetical protein n=1 Tax=Kitasatospora sp. NPDC056783 TaxID=3345943 RepID=UPI0036AE9929